MLTRRTARLRRGATACILSAVTLACAAARADEDDHNQANGYALSGRASLGLGGGDLGIGGRLGLSGEYWLAGAWGVGLQGALMGQTSTVGLGSGTEGSAWIVAPVVALRSAHAGGYFLGTAGAGYAFVQRTQFPGLCINFGGGGCASSSTAHSGYAVAAALGWLGHPGRSGFEIGPVARFDLVGGFGNDEPVDYLLTLNLELGFAWASEAGR